MLKGIKIFKNSIFYDKIGYIWTSWKKSKKKFKKLEFIHDKFSISKKNVLRGFHWDKKTWKLISCVYGRIFFVVLNCNRNSKSYFKHTSSMRVIFFSLIFFNILSVSPLKPWACVINIA